MNLKVGLGERDSHGARITHSAAIIDSKRSKEKSLSVLWREKVG